MIYPLLILHLLDNGLDFGQIGLILGFLYGTGRLASVVLGVINDLLGSKLISCVGLLLRAAGISVFLFHTDITIYLAFSVLASLGASAAALGMKSELMRFSATRKHVTLRSMAINSGAILGPALGAGLYHIFDFNIILIISTIMYLVLALGLSLLRFSPPESKTVKPKADNQPHNENTWSRFLAILIITGMYWFIYAQRAIKLDSVQNHSAAHFSTSHLHRQ